MKDRRLQHKVLAAVLAGGVVLSQLGGAVTVYGAAPSQTTNPTISEQKDILPEQDLITRVDETNETGLIRSHFEDSEGNIYTDSSAAGTQDASTDTPAGSRKVSSGLKLKKASTFPAQYDLRNQNLTTSIKDQGVTGCCWAFSAIKVIESNCIKNGLFAADSVDFSENHLAWFSYHPATSSSDPTYQDGIRYTSSVSAYYPDPLTVGSSAGTAPYDTGGSAVLANFTLAKWTGAELESNAPFTANTSSEEASMAASMAQKENLRYDSYAHLQNVYNYDEYIISDQYYYNSPGIIDKMKQGILDYGAMSVSLYFDKTYFQTTSAGTSYYQNLYTGSTAVESANHSVTIVGWDDSYSRDNFVVKPSANGAWLIANSYGTESGDAGYFWLSYYDQSICDCSSFLMESPDNYGHIYQYDGFGWGIANYSDSYNLKAANIFTADSTSAQQLRAVSFYTLTDNQPYKIQVYRGVTAGPTDGTLISECTTTGTAVQNGYHTIPLQTPVNVAAGERFSVVVTYLQEGAARIYVPLEGRGEADAKLSIRYGSQTGQSFLYTKLTSSTGSTSRKWIDTSAQGYNNVCIKAFTDNTASADPLPETLRTVTIGKGETYKISGSYVSYTSNDSTLATVSSSGKVTAKKEGVTTILLSDGAANYLVRIKIKKAPSKITLKPAKKKTIRKGRHFTLKVKLPSGSASRKLTFHSSKPRIATVSSKGRVTARRRGTTKITVRTYNGRKAALLVTVRA